MKNTVIALGLAVVPLVGFAAPNDTPGAPSYSYFQGDWVVDGNAQLREQAKVRQLGTLVGLD